MKPEAQRIAIAEAVGFSWQTWGKTTVRLHYPKSGWVPYGWTKPAEGYVLWPLGKKSAEAAVGELLAQIPFDSDLNAMHEAEKAKFTDRYSRLLYDDYLLSVTTAGRDKLKKEPSDEEWSAVIHATASQRAEAFLRTIGKWEES